MDEFEEYGIEDYDAELLTRGDYDAVLRLRENQLKKNPHDYWARYRWAEILELTGKYNEALKILSGLHQEEPEDEDTIDLVLDCLRKTNQSPDGFKWRIKPKISLFNNFASIFNQFATSNQSVESFARSSDQMLRNAQYNRQQYDKVESTLEIFIAELMDEFENQKMDVCTKNEYWQILDLILFGGGGIDFSKVSPNSGFQTAKKAFDKERHDIILNTADSTITKIVNTEKENGRTLIAEMESKYDSLNGPNKYGETMLMEAADKNNFFAVDVTSQYIE